jgi:hypothetical protein
MSRIAILLVLVAALCGMTCTDQERAKHHGGTATVKLPCGQKILGATWKDDDLWYLTRPFRPGEPAEKVTFWQRKNLKGITGNGKVVLVECAD